MDINMPSGFDDDPPPETHDGWLLVRIHVPEQNVYKCLQFPSERLVWDVKQQVLASLPKELKESFNYGLFSPPSNGKAGKFLDEERCLGDYPFSGPVGYLELKYKRRVYKMLNLDERQLKALHTRANLRRFLEYINGGQVEKIAKMCAKGLDPNFHCPESGDTPLTIAAGMKKPNKLLIALVNGGALLDYRTKDGATALHKAVEKNSLEAVTTLLELGASPNYKDGRGITPLYISIIRKCDQKISESLLHDHAVLGIQDSQGWQEVHQACRHGLIHHLEHLLFYGADMDGRNASGNTPLHVCAVNNQEACARMLLFRGAQRGALNYANQTPYQVAVIAGNLELADIIQNYKSDDVDKCLGDTSDIISDSSGVGTNSDSAACSIGHPSTTVVCLESYAGNSVGHIRLQPGDVIEVVGSTDCGLLEGYIRGSNNSGFFPAEFVQEVSLRQKNVTNVPASSSQSLPCHQRNSSFVQPGSPQLSVGGSSGISGGYTLPYHIVSQHQSPRQHYLQHQQHRQSPSLSMNSNVSGQAMNSTDQTGGGQQYNSSTAPRMKKTALNGPRTVVLHRANRGFGFILRGAKASSPLMQLKPSNRFPALQYLDDVDPGGVADMAGLRPGDFLLAIGGEDVRATSHEKVVEMIRSAGALVSMTVISPHFPNQLQTVPQYLPSGGNHHISSGPSTPQTAHRQCATLPRKMSFGPAADTGITSRMPAPIPPRRDPKTTLSVGRARAKSMVAGLENGSEKDEDGVPHTKSNSVESIANATSTHPRTPVQLRTASIKARPTSSRITAAELEELFQRQQGETTSESIASPYSNMMTTSRFQSGTDGTAASPPASSYSPIKAPLVYGSVSEMKRKTKTKNGTLRGKPCPIPTVGGDLKRFHSTPDLNTHQTYNSSTSSVWYAVSKGHHSQDDVATLHASMHRLNVPPPSHPPPPPPTFGQMVKVETRNSTSEYEGSLTLQRKLKKHVQREAVTSAIVKGVQSSFNPAANAKVYASPQELGSVISWKLRQTPENPHQSLSESITTPLQQKPQLPKQQQLQICSSNSCTVSPESTSEMRTNLKHKLAEEEQQKLQQKENVGSGRNGNTNNNNSSSNNNENNNNKGSANNNNDNNNSNNNSNEESYSSAPPIPEPDYSLSESDGDDENSILVARNTKLNEKIALIDIVSEISGNSQASGGSSSSGSGSGFVSHSLSADEIQRIRSNLKTSTSYPNDLFRKSNKQYVANSSSDECAENHNSPGNYNKSTDNVTNHNNTNAHNNEGDEAFDDNSSSGVSSDQEIALAPNKSTDTIKKRPSITINIESTNMADAKKAITSTCDESLHSISTEAFKASQMPATPIEFTTETTKSAPIMILQPTTSHRSTINISKAISSIVELKATNSPTISSSAMVDSTVTLVPAATIISQPPETPPTPTNIPISFAVNPNATTTSVLSRMTTTTTFTAVTIAEIISEAPETLPTVADQATNFEVKTTEATSSAIDKKKRSILASVAAATSPEPITLLATVPSATTDFETKASTVTVKQILQQKNPSAVQQSQQLQQHQPQPDHVASAKAKTVLVQNQKFGFKGNPVMAGRITHNAFPQQQQQLSKQHKEEAEEDQLKFQIHSYQKLSDITQSVLRPQQKLQKQQYQFPQQQLQQIPKSKPTPLGPTTAAANDLRQQELRRHVKGLPELFAFDSEHEQRSDDDGELSSSPPAKAFQRHNSLTRKKAAALAMQRATRNAAVSLVQLPPPIEADSDNELTLSSSIGVINATNADVLRSSQTELCTDNIVLAPPPQFCDCNDRKHTIQQQKQLQQHQHKQ